MKSLLGGRKRRNLAAAVSSLVLSILLAVSLSADSSARKDGHKRGTKAAPERVQPVSGAVESVAETGPQRAGHAPSPRRSRQGRPDDDDNDRAAAAPQRESQADAVKNRRPVERFLRRGRSWDGDLRTLPQTRPVRRERPEHEGPPPAPKMHPGAAGTAGQEGQVPTIAIAPGPSAPAPSPDANFAGLDFANFGAGHPPDTNGDVGPDHYIQSINTSIGIFRKSDGFREAAFTFDTFMSQANAGNLCDTDNFGDPVVVYDTFEDRWVITDFAFQLDVSGNVSPPKVLQCFAVSKSGDPLTGGWNFYSIETVGGLGDYPKLGVWPDGIYMSANMFGYAAASSFQGVRLFAFNKAQMYAGAPAVQVVSIDVGPGDFTVLPANARLQTGTPPPGTPNYFVSTWNFLNALTVYKFHVDWKSISLSTVTGPDIPIAATSWPNAAVPNAPSLGGNVLDVLQIRAMMQNQYTNIGGVESLWTTHTVRRGNTSGFAAPRWYQVNVTGGTVAPNIPQAATWDPDGANVIYRFMPSLAVDRQGDMALGYSTSSSTTKPAIKYAGRLATDPVNTFSQTEQLLFQGLGTQTGNCGGATCTRWGDYSAMALDPDGCTFWYTNMYYAVDGLNHQTQVGSFRYPECTPLAAGGTLTGTVTRTGGAPVSGATVTLGSRTTTTAGDGTYTFLDLPAGTYPSATASFPGLNSSTATSIVVTEGGTTTQDFLLSVAATNGCFVDTTQGDFQTGVPTNCDLITSPGAILLPKPDVIDQQNTTLGIQGAGFNNTTWLGQTFTAAATGPVTRVDVNFFSLNCGSVTMPDLTVAIRNAASNLPSGADLATATIPGFCNGGGGWFTATFATPATITAGTQYAIVWRASGPVPGGSPAPGYFGTVSVGSGSVALQNPYAGGRRASSANSGVTWAGAAGNANNDHGFKIYLNLGYTPAGNLISSAKDANPAVGSTSTWGNLTWTATTPTGTNVQFQATASNNVEGPFNFVGPDSTAATFFANGDSLAQFNGLRYLKYKALLSTTDTTVTPTVDMVSVCFDDLIVTTLTVAPASGPYGGTADLTATLTAGSGVAGKTVSFTLNGVPAGSATTDASGVATVSAASLSGISPGTYPGGVAATFAGDTDYRDSNGSNTLTVAKLSQTITFNPLPNRTFGDPDFGVSATASSGLAVTFAAAGQCTVTADGTVVHLTGVGSCTITASEAGNGTYNPAPDVPQTFTISDDLIFRDGFESGDLSAWSTSSTDGGDLSVGAEAALASTSFGLHAAVNDTSTLSVQDNTPSKENRYRVRFWMDTQDFDPGTALGHFRTRIFLALEEAPRRRLAAIVLKYQGGQYSVMGRVLLDDDTRADTAFLPIAPGAHAIEFDWQRSSTPTALDGSFQLWIDGTSVANLTGLDNNASSVDMGRLGALSLKDGASGNLYFDEFVSRRLNYTGP
jgi:hypothetical protein